MKRTGRNKFTNSNSGNLNQQQVSPAVAVDACLGSVPLIP
jgi:hypothetical protein